jgi:hypothetical protein
MKTSMKNVIEACEKIKEGFAELTSAIKNSQQPGLVIKTSAARSRRTSSTSKPGNATELTWKILRSSHTPLTVKQLWKAIAAQYPSEAATINRGAVKGALCSMRKKYWITARKEPGQKRNKKYIATSRFPKSYTPYEHRRKCT